VERGEEGCRTADFLPKGRNGGFIFIHGDGECYLSLEHIPSNLSVVLTVCFIVFFHEHEWVLLDVTMKVYIRPVRGKMAV
jgi:hypothetical protein